MSENFQWYEIIKLFLNQLKKKRQNLRMTKYSYIVLANFV